MIDFSRKSTQEEQVYKKRMVMLLVVMMITKINACGLMGEGEGEGGLHKSERIKQSGVQII